MKPHMKNRGKYAKLIILCTLILLNWNFSRQKEKFPIHFDKSIEKCLNNWMSGSQRAKPNKVFEVSGPLRKEGLKRRKFKTFQMSPSHGKVKIQYRCLDNVVIQDKFVYSGKKLFSLMFSGLQATLKGVQGLWREEKRQQISDVIYPRRYHAIYERGEEARFTREHFC